MVGQVLSSSSYGKSSQVILGTPFIRQYYTVLNFTANALTVSFAPNVNLPVLNAMGASHVVSVGGVAAITIVVLLIGIMSIVAPILLKQKQMWCY